HAHRVAAEREERAVAEREDAAIAPDQIDREREDRVADIFAPQRHQVGWHVPGRGWRQQQIEQRHRHADRDQHQDERNGAAVERTDQRRTRHTSTARPLRANSPRGRFWINRMMATRITILPSTAPAKGSRNLFATPSVNALISVPHRLPTPPNTTTRKLSMI